MKTILYEGKEVQAFDFIMKKENALDIISGKKKVEFRDMSPYYARIFDNGDRNEKGEKLPRKDINFIHFHNYTNSWFLDVKIKGVGVGFVNKNYHDALSKKYDCYNFENDWQQYEGKPDDEIPTYFYIPILEIINYNL